jgi:uncharacterized BrkB/YihY/UPF0761 family membrane protein
VQALGGYQAPSDSAQLAGGAALLLALVATGVLERLQFRLRDAERSTWWASNERDLLNLLALAVLTFACALLGFSTALSLLVSGTLVVLVNTLQASLGQRPYSGLASVGAAVVLGLPALFAPSTLARGLSGLLGALFGGGGQG